METKKKKTNTKTKSKSIEKKSTEKKDTKKKNAGVKVKNVNVKASTSDKKVVAKKEKVIEKPVKKEIKNPSRFMIWYNANKIKLFKGLGIGIGLVALIVAAALIPTKEKNTVSRIIDTTAAEYFEHLNGDDAKVVFIGSPTCSWCQKYKPIITRIANEYEINIYYINTSSLSSIDYTNIHNSSSSLKDQYNSNGQPIIPTPTTLIVKGGKEIGSAEGAISYDQLKSLLKDKGVIK